MSEEIPPADDAAEDSASSLADAIAAHLALKKEHGADAEEVEHELEDALSPPRRGEDSEPPVAEVAEPEPEPAPEPEPVREPEPLPEPEPETLAEPEPELLAEPEPEPDLEKPGEITGTIEFEWDKDAAGVDAPEAEPEVEEGHDLLEDTPDFFEETPEHDKLWFDEAPPRKFDF